MTRSPLDVITDDLSWREAELGSLKLLLSRNDVSDHQKVVLLRASWALLYAHYEGFSKTSLAVFYDYAKRAVTNCGILPVKTRLFALDKKIKSYLIQPKTQCLKDFEYCEGLQKLYKSLQ